MHEAVNSVNVIRSVKRSDLKDVRTKHKEFLLYNKRLRLHEISEYVHDVTLSEFNELLLKLKQKNVPLEILKKVKNSCVSDDYIEALFKNEGAFNSLLRILISSDAQKQLETAACLTNLICGSHKCSYKVAKASGVYLISFIDGNSYFLQDQSIWALANIANDCLECFNVIKSQGVLPALLKALKSPLPNVVQSAVFALNACTKYEDTEVISLTQTDLPKHLLLLLDQNNINSYVFLDAAFTFSNCCFLSTKYSLDVFDIKTAERLVSILLKVIQNTEINIMTITPLIRCIGFLSYDDKICEFLASNSNFYSIIQSITCAKDCMYLIKETIWFLTNITISTNAMCHTSDLMPLFNNLKMILKEEKSVTMQVLYYLSILISKNKSLSLQLLHHDIFADIKSLLEGKEEDILKATSVFLQIIEKQ